MSRPLARAISCEMVSGFTNMRGELSCHLFGRVPDFVPSSAAHSDTSRVFEIWGERLDRSGGPFLFGDFCIADAVYFPMLTRLRTYGVPLPETIKGYERVLDTLPAVRNSVELARTEPRVPIYDDYVRGLGGDPDAAPAV